MQTNADPTLESPAHPPFPPTPDLVSALPTPLEQLRLPPALSGAVGSNRAPATATRIAATDDLAAVTAWLARYVDSPATVTAYRREVERLLLWAVLQLGKPLSSLTHEDLLVYERFLADPQPAARWVLAGSKKLARNHPDWRPFAGPLSPASVLVILNALFAWLTEAGYLAGNPLALARRRRAQRLPAQRRGCAAPGHTGAASDRLDQQDVGARACQSMAFAHGYEPHLRLSAGYAAASATRSVHGRPSKKSAMIRWRLGCISFTRVRRVMRRSGRWIGMRNGRVRVGIASPEGRSTAG